MNSDVGRPSTSQTLDLGSDCIDHCLDHCLQLAGSVLEEVEGGKGKVISKVGKESNRENQCERPTV